MKKFSALTMAALLAAGAAASVGMAHHRYVANAKSTPVENNDTEPLSAPVKAQSPAKAAAVYALPFAIFDNEDSDEAKASFKQCTVINANGDTDKNGNAKTWFYANYGASSSGEPTYAPDKKNDDWFILPGVQFIDGNVNYELKVGHGCNIGNMASDFELYIGTAPTVEAMTTKIGECLDFKVAVKDRGTAIDETYTFALPDGKPGTYYIGIRDITYEAEGRNVFSSWFRNFRITAKETSASMAAQISNAVVTPGENGALEATVSFNMPSKDMTGKDISASKLVTAVITCGEETKTLSGAPGSEQTVKLTTKQGNNEISIRADLDGVEGEPFFYNVYTGEVLATRIQGLTAEISEDNMQFSLSWDKPLGGVDNGYVDMNRIRYDIYRKYGNEDEKTLLTTTTDHNYTFVMPSGAKQTTTTIYVLARTDAGVSTDEYNYTYDDNDVYKTAVLGTPYVIPASENFAGGQITLSPVRREVPEGYRGKWEVTMNDMLEGGNEWCLFGYSPYSDYEEDVETMGRLGLPKITTEGLHNAAFNLKVMKYSVSSKKMQILASAYGIEPVKIADVDLSSENMAWGEYSFVLPEQFQDKKWVQIYIDVDYTDPQSYYVIDSYSFSNAAGRDLAVTNISAPSVLSVGEEGEIEATVYNQGAESLLPKGKFSVISSGTVIAQSDELSSTELQPNSSCSFKWKYAPVFESTKKDIVVKFELTSSDDIAANNSAQASISVVEAETPVVSDLAAEYDKTAPNKARLQWSQPDLTKPMTESFEDIKSFYYGDEYATFTGVDGDGKDVFIFSDNDMPNQGEAKSWLTIDDRELARPEGLEAHSGNKYLMAICPYADKNVPAVAADDWLISSEVKAGSRISFWSKIISESYPETFRVMYSTTDTDTKSFKELKSETISRLGWKQFAYILPADAKYFAINYVSKDKFGFIVDDIRHMPLTSTYNVTSYNIYRNGTKVGSTSQLVWDDAEHTIGDTYTVTAVVDGEEMPHSNVAIAAESGVTLILDDTSDAEIFNLSGVRVNGSEITPGVYIINGKKVKL